MAASQCTMNNFTFGNARYQYYETIAGGSGAGPEFAGQRGPDAHDQFALTDPEVLEFAFRCGSSPMRFVRDPAARALAGRRRRSAPRAISRAHERLDLEQRPESHGAFGMAGGRARRGGQDLDRKSSMAAIELDGSYRFGRNGGRGQSS
jgi:5-oxoprolinase (ATP-hydrolysing)